MSDTPAGTSCRGKIGARRLEMPCGCRAPPAQKLPLRAGTLVLVDPAFFELPDRALSVLRFPGASIAKYRVPVWVRAGPFISGSAARRS
jgi:hypothetical protein